MIRWLLGVLIVVLAPIGVLDARQAMPLHGAVIDAQGRAIAGATISLVAPDGRLIARATSNASGHWELAAVAHAETVEVSAEGFQTARRPLAFERPGAVLTTALSLAPMRDQVVVTAVAGDRPLEVVTLARQPRQPVPAHDGADYLDTIPGFSSVRKGGSGGDPVFRGMAGSRLAVLADGATILGGCSSRMDAPTAYVFPETYDLITVIKGPQTVTRGVVGSAGTVLFERVNDRLTGRTWLANAVLTAGAFGRHDEVVDIKAGAPSFYLRAAGSRSAIGDYRDGNGQAVHSRVARWNADTTVGWTPDAATRVEMTTSLSDGQAAYADRGVDGAKFRRTGIAVTFERARISQRLREISMTAAYNYVDHVMDNFTLRAFQPTMMTPEPSAMNPDRTTYSGRAAATWSIGAGALESGVDWQANAHTSRTSMRQYSMPVATMTRIADGRFATAGLFAELDYPVRLGTRLVSGVRVDRASGTDQRQVVALAMMTSMPNPSANARRVDVLSSGFARLERTMTSRPVTWYAGVGRAARFPDFWELMTKESEATLSAFETRPERTTQVDAGLQVRRKGTSAYVSAFASAIEDFILIETGLEKQAMTGVRVATVTRSVDARTIGAEAGVTQRLGTAWTVDGSLAYTRGVNETDHRPLAQIPPLEGRLSAQYEREAWSLGGLARVVAAQRRVALNQGSIVGQDIRATDGFGVVSVNAGWKIASAVSLTGGIDNLLDAAYAEHISRPSAAIPGFVSQIGQVREPGRTAWVRLNVRH